MAWKKILLKIKVEECGSIFQTQSDEFKQQPFPRADHAGGLNPSGQVYSWQSPIRRHSFPVLDPKSFELRGASQKKSPKCEPGVGLEELEMKQL